MSTNKSAWYLLYCKGRQELRAQINLRNQGIDSFFPVMKQEKIVRKKRTVVETALFPNYLFVAINEEQDSFTSIRSTRGVIDFVRTKQQYSKVPFNIVDALLLGQSTRKTEESIGHPFSSGDKVEIKGGSFQGIDAVYKCSDGLERSILLLNMLNKQSEISVANDSFNTVIK